MRKEVDITITAEGRDKGKVFHLREMPASQAERWALRALFAAVKAGVEIPDNLLGGGMQTIAFVGINALMRMNFYEVEPLLDEMMGCIRIKPDIRNPSLVRDLIEDDIEEIATRIQLRREALGLHVNFSLAGAPSKPTSVIAPASAI